MKKLLYLVSVIVFLYACFNAPTIPEMLDGYDRACAQNYAKRVVEIVTDAQASGLDLKNVGIVDEDPHTVVRAVAKGLSFTDSFGRSHFYTFEDPYLKGPMGDEVARCIDVSASCGSFMVSYVSREDE